MGNMLVNTRDQKFLLYEQIGIEKLFETEKYADYNKETVDMMINEAEKLAVEVLLPTYDKGDKEGCKFEKGRVKVPACFHDAYKKFCEAGWLCCMRSVESGGQGMPNSVAQAATSSSRPPTTPSSCTRVSPTARPASSTATARRSRRRSTWKGCTPASGGAPCASPSPAPAATWAP